MARTPPSGRLALRALGRALIGFALLVASGCTSTPSSPPGDNALHPSEAWFAAYDAALRQGVFNAGSFYTDDAVVDLRSVGRPVVAGREDLLEALGAAFEPYRNETPREGSDIYASRTGAVEVAPVREPSADPNRLVALNDYGPDGLTSQTFAISELAWRAGRPADPRMLGLQVLTRDYTLAWASGSPEAVAGLYTPSATLADDLAGIQAGSRDQITALAGTTPARGGLPNAIIDGLPDLSGPAVFLVASTDFANKDPIRVVTMLVTSDDGQGCPGHIAVRLDLDDHGLVERETRYHRVDTPDRCLPHPATVSSDTDTAWWEEIAIPDPVAKVRTSVLTIADRDVAMFNSTPDLDRLTTWAVGRFTSAHLTAPQLTEVAWYDPRVDFCHDTGGLAAGTAVSLCFNPWVGCKDTACTSGNPRAMETTLHELAHVWMADLTKGTQQRFTEQAGLARWADTTDDWRERGVELAAATIAGALMDEHRTVRGDLAARSCDELAALFTTLTGQPAPTTKDCPTTG